MRRTFRTISARRPASDRAAVPAAWHALRYVALCGYAVSPFYDSLLGKLIVWIRRARCAAPPRSRARRTENRGRHHDGALASASRGGARNPSRSISHTVVGAMADHEDEAAGRHDGAKQPMNSRYSFGGDEHIFVECDEAMSLEAFFKSLSVTKAVRAAQIRGSPKYVQLTPRSRSSSIRTSSSPTISCAS